MEKLTSIFCHSLIFNSDFGSPINTCASPHTTDVLI